MVDPTWVRAARPGRVRGIGVELWRRGLADPHAAAATWSRGLREARMLHSAERRLVGDQLAALCRQAPGLARALGTDDPDTAWLGALVLAGLPAEEVLDLELGGLPEAWRALAATPLDALRWHHGFPEPFAERLLADLGVDESLAFARAGDARAPLDLRVVRSRATVEHAVVALAEDGVEVVAIGPGALRVTAGRGVEQSRALRAGLVEVQDLGSQRLGAMVGDAPTQVLDLCAGAGGKALQLADAGHQVTACDPRGGALQELQRRASRSRLQIRTVVATSGDTPELRGRTFPVVLVDAPCSGTGTWRRTPTLRWRWSLQAEADHAALQRAILDAAARFVAPGGRLVYGTCSVARAEDEDVALAFANTHPGFAAGATLRTWPHRDGADGFFGAVFTRSTP